MHNFVIMIITVIYFNFENIQNRRNMFLWASSEGLVIYSNTGMKCWPCRSTTPSDQFQAFFIEYSNATIFAWTLDVSQLKKKPNVLNRNFDWFIYKSFLTVTCWNERTVRVVSTAAKTVCKLFVGGVRCTVVFLILMFCDSKFVIIVARQNKAWGYL